MNRGFEFKQSVNDLALVYKLERRAGEGEILTVEQLKERPFTLALLVKLAEEEA